jgi:hypothetical protein
MAIEHDFFGLIEDNGFGGLRWFDTLDFGDQAVPVDLSADDETAVPEIVLGLAAAMIRAIEGFDQRARDALIAQLSKRTPTPTAQYIDRIVHDAGAALPDLLAHDSGDVPMDVLRSLRLVHVGLYPQRDEDGADFAVFDYSLRPDDTDYLLVVGFDIQGDVASIALLD